MQTMYRFTVYTVHIARPKRNYSEVSATLSFYIPPHIFCKIQLGSTGGWAWEVELVNICCRIPNSGSDERTMPWNPDKDVFLKRTTTSEKAQSAEAHQWKWWADQHRADILFFCLYCCHIENIQHAVQNMQRVSATCYTFCGMKLHDRASF